MIDKLRNTFNDKLDDLSGRIDKLQADTTAEDEREQGEIDSLK
jgi:predicted  nucleic acid-binding Zn-ribbon protein